MIRKLVLRCLVQLENRNSQIAPVIDEVIRKNQLSKGGITGTLVDVRLVLKNALEVGATALILCHNHPSGTLKPSEADKAVTTKLKTAAKSLDIKVGYTHTLTQEGLRCRAQVDPHNFLKGPDPHFFTKKV